MLGVIPQVPTDLLTFVKSSWYSCPVPFGMHEVVKVTQCVPPVVVPVKPVAAPAAPVAAPTPISTVYTLSATNAQLSGPKISRAVLNGTTVISSWDNRVAFVMWPLKLPTAGKYTVDVEYALAPDADNTYLTIFSDKKVVLKGMVPPTGGWSDFKTVTIGKISIPAGWSVLSVRGWKKDSNGIMLNLHSVTLRPASDPASSPQP